MAARPETISFDEAFKKYKGARTFTVMLKPVGSVCNLNCTYCYYLEKKDLYPETSNFKLDENLLEEFTRKYIQEQDVDVITFVWQGGEPGILGIDYYKKALALQKKYAGDKKISNVFQTNGTFIDENWCQFFKDNNFLVGISVDGPEKLHDYYRKTKQGQPSFHRVMKSVELLHRYRVEFNTLTVVNNLTSQFPLEVYNFLKAIGSTYMQFIPIVERNAIEHEKLKLVDQAYNKEARLTNWSVNPKKFGSFLCSIFDEWVKKDVGRHYVQLFDVSLANWYGEPPGLCVFEKTCGMTAVMEHNGDLFSCDHFVYDKYRLGNIKNHSLAEILHSKQQSDFSNYKFESLPQYCQDCNYLFACHGACPKHRFLKTPEGETGLNYLCESYKMFFEHITPAMEFMVNEIKNNRAPANIMKDFKF
jgi:uncharacterized protein